MLRALPETSESAVDLAPLTPGGGTASADGEDRFRLFDAVVRVLHAAAGPAGLLVVLDDVHRADPASLLLHHVAGQLRGSRLLLLATHDVTTAGAPLPSGPAVERLDLRGLSGEAVERRSSPRSSGPPCQP